MQQRRITVRENPELRGQSLSSDNRAARVFKVKRNSENSLPVPYPTVNRIEGHQHHYSTPSLPSLRSNSVLPPDQIQSSWPYENIQRPQEPQYSYFVRRPAHHMQEHLQRDPYARENLNNIKLRGTEIVDDVDCKRPSMPPYASHQSTISYDNDKYSMRNRDKFHTGGTGLRSYKGI